MRHKKSTPIIGEHNRKTCPVCGKRSYSAGGIHPQCAVQQADSAREQQLKAQKKIEAEKKAVAKKPSATWRKKTCPKCGRESHVRKRTCECGFDFFQS
jgi:ribosomal protein L37E